MSKAIKLSDEQYQTIEQAAATRGQTFDTLLAQWIEELRDRDRDPRYFETNEWFRHLGVSDAVIEEVWRDVRAEAETDDTFRDGSEQRPGEPHIVWRRIGRHDIPDNP